MKITKRGPWLGGAALAWALAAGLPLQAQAQTDDLANNVVIVLDASGSMESNMGDSGIQKMRAAKTALKEILRQVPAETQIGLLVFSAAEPETEWLYPLGPRDDAKLAQAIDAPQPGFKTPLGAYIRMGADRLLEERDKQRGNGTYRLLIVTDGEADDQDLVDRYVPEIMARGLLIDAIGVDMDQTHTLATQVNSYRSANDPASLEKALAEIFAEVGTTSTDAAGQDAYADIAPLPDEMAAAMLKALAEVNNEPIDGPSSGGDAASDASSSSSAGSSSSGASSSKTSPSGSKVSTLVFWVAVILVIRSVIRSRRRHR